MRVGGHKGALRNEQLFVGLVGIAYSRLATCLLHPNHISLPHSISHALFVLSRTVTFIFPSFVFTDASVLD